MVACAFCDGPCERWHHPTGRDEHDRYLDPDFVRPTCHNHHELLHDDAQTLGWEKLGGHQMTWFERVELRLRRWAAFLGRLDDSSSVPTLNGVVARMLLRWADEIATGIRLLDEHVPQWRSLREFYAD